MSEPPADAPFDIAIVGGGFSGLAIAHHLKRAASGRRMILLEASARLGGKALTEIVERGNGRFIIEAGPDSFLAAKPWAKQLAIDLGLEDRLIPINLVDRPVSILKHGRFVRMPAGINLAAPARIKPFVESPLLSPSGRARVLREPRIPPASSERDESVGSFIRRRLGAELLDWIAEPLMAGIYNGHPDAMSLLATFPQLRAQEQTQGGVIRAARAARAMRTGARQPAFLTLRNGMQELIDALAASVTDVGRVSSAVIGVRRRTSGFEIALESGERIVAREAILAISASAAATLLGADFPEAVRRLRGFRANSAGSISLAFPAAAIARPLPGYGLLIPMREGRPINAITVASRKFDQRAPAGSILLRLFFGGARSPETMLLDDDELREVARRQLEELLGVSTRPELSRIYRWPAGSPQYDVGHLDRVSGVEGALPTGLHLAGSSYRGVGLPDLAKEASRLASSLAARMTV